MAALLRIAIGEDSYLVREGIVHALEHEPRIRIVASEGDAEALRAAVERLAPDVVVTDVDLPPAGADEGIRLAHDLALSHPAIGVVVLSAHAHPAYATALFADSERRAYLLKDRITSRDAVIEAIEAVSDGMPVLDADVLMMSLGTPAVPGEALAELTKREFEVLALLAEGRSNRAIGEELSITERAVERHVNGIFVKLGLRDSRRENRRVVAALLYTRAQGGA